MTEKHISVCLQPIVSSPGGVEGMLSCAHHSEFTRKAWRTNVRSRCWYRFTKPVASRGATRIVSPWA